MQPASTRRILAQNDVARSRGCSPSEITTSRAMPSTRTGTRTDTSAVTGPRQNTMQAAAAHMRIGTQNVCETHTRTGSTVIRSIGPQAAGRHRLGVTTICMPCCLVMTFYGTHKKHKIGFETRCRCVAEHAANLVPYEYAYACQLLTATNCKIYASNQTRRGAAFLQGKDLQGGPAAPACAAPNLPLSLRKQGSVSITTTAGAVNGAGELEEGARAGVWGG